MHHKLAYLWGIAVVLELVAYFNFEQRQAITTVLFLLVFAYAVCSIVPVIGQVSLGLPMFLAGTWGLGFYISFNLAQPAFQHMFERALTVRLITAYFELSMLGIISYSATKLKIDGKSKKP